MLLLIDNYDSFVYNLRRYLLELGCETCVVRNDEISVGVVARLRPQGIVISPGPCTPAEAGASVAITQAYYETLPILGVCLGHQVIAAALGGRVVSAAVPVHGRTSLIHHDSRALFRGIPNPLTATRYHSLIVDEHSLPEPLEVTARTADGIPMAIAHRRHPVFGVQFHPEKSREAGLQIIKNFTEIN